MDVCLACGSDDVCDPCRMYNRLDQGRGRGWYDVPLPMDGYDETAGQVVESGEKQSGPRLVTEGLTNTFPSEGTT